MNRIKDYIISFFKMIQKRFKADKVKHFTMGYFIFDLTKKILLNQVERNIIYVLIGFLIVTIAAILKEFWNKYQKNSKFDYWDLIITAVGGLLCYLI